MKFWFTSFTSAFCIEKAPWKIIKAKWRKAEHCFVDRVFNHDLTKFENDWDNVAVVGARARLYSQSPIKIPATKDTLMLPLNYSGHPLSQPLTGPAKKLEIPNVRDSGKFKIIVFYKTLGKPNTAFTSALTLVSLNVIVERKHINTFTVIYFRLK